MSLAELLAAVRALSDRDKLQLIRELADDLDQGTTEHDVHKLIPPGVELPIWSPYESYEAAAILQRLADEQKGVS